MNNEIEIAKNNFYLAFPKVQALSAQLTLSHYVLLLRLENPKAREYYIEECREGDV